MNESRAPETPRRLPPPELPQRWLDARREVALRRWGRRAFLVLLLVGLVLLGLNWWIVAAYVKGREQALAEVCADSPFASGSVTAAGGPEVVTEPAHPALDAYRGDPEGRSAAALRIRDHAALLDDHELASAAAGVATAGPFLRLNEIAHIETRCARYLERVGDPP